MLRGFFPAEAAGPASPGPGLITCADLSPAKRFSPLPVRAGFCLENEFGILLQAIECRVVGESWQTDGAGIAVLIAKSLGNQRRGGVSKSAGQPQPSHFADKPRHIGSGV